ncbi:MAE_28990/MAE_18760 family HEPN-like nuclease [Clostridium butyricum]
MEVKFECLDNYLDSLKEVALIVDMANNNIQNNEEYVALNKSAILLLAAKFENFIEAIVEEFVYYINELHLPNEQVPEWMRIGFSIDVVNDLMKVMSKEENSKKITFFKNIPDIWNDQKNTKMKVNNKFNYGKHGANELIKLFNNIGIKDIFKTIKVYSLEESLLGELEEHDFKGTFNNITNQRNYITHQDGSTNITHSEISKYKEYFKQFAEKLSEYLICEIEKLNSLEEDTQKQIAATLS